MKKSEVIQAVRDFTGLRGDVVSSVIESLGQIASSRISQGESVLLPGIGQIVLRDRGARTVRNPRTGEAFELKPTRKVVFKPVKRLRELAVESLNK